MKKLAARGYLGILQTGLLLTAGTALADGGTYTSTSAPEGPILAQVNFQCQGGVRVQVTKRAKTVRVTFADRSQVLDLNRDPGGTSARNTQFI